MHGHWGRGAEERAGAHGAVGVPAVAAFLESVAERPADSRAVGAMAGLDVDRAGHCASRIQTWWRNGREEMCQV